MKGEQVHGTGLKLGDEVMLWVDSCWGGATVKKITEHYITLFRPYVHTDDYETTAGVACFIGIEEFSCGKNAMFLRTRRGKVA